MATRELPYAVDQILNANTVENGSVERANQQFRPTSGHSRGAGHHSNDGGRKSNDPLAASIDILDVCRYVYHTYFHDQDVGRSRSGEDLQQ